MNKLRDDLRREHERLEQLLVQLCNESDSVDPRSLQRTWTELENCLRRHLQTEERQLLPLFVASHPDEVRSILGEHRHIRQLVAELGVQLDLHLLRRNAILQLVRLLREHAQAEDRSLHVWVTQVDDSANAGL